MKIPHPCGDPTLDAAHDRSLRMRIVRGALRALATPLDSSRLFDAEAA